MNVLVHMYMQSFVRRELNLHGTLRLHLWFCLLLQCAKSATYMLSGMQIEKCGMQIAILK